MAGGKGNYYRVHGVVDMYQRGKRSSIIGIVIFAIEVILRDIIAAYSLIASLSMIFVAGMTTIFKGYFEDWPAWLDSQKSFDKYHSEQIEFQKEHERSRFARIKEEARDELLKEQFKEEIKRSMESGKE